MAQAALDALIDTHPREYFARVGHQTRMQVMHAQCASAGLLTTSSSADDVSRLYSLFSLALEHGFGTLVVDYLAEVCADSGLTSSDPTQAFLMDGQCVRRWLQRSLQVGRARVVAALGQGLGAAPAQGVLGKAAAELATLHLVAASLAAPGAAAAAADASEVARATHAARVGAWVAARGWGGRQPPRFASEAEWRSVAGRRRGTAAATPAATLFVSDACAALTERHACGALAYPPPSTERLVQTLFLAGDVDQAAWEAKLQLLVTFLVDGGWCTRVEALEQLWLQWNIPRPTAAAWLLQHYLDAAFCPEHASGCNALDDAVACAAEVMGTVLPLKTLAVLQERGRGVAAVALLRQRCLPAQVRDLDETSAALSICLDNGLLAEGVLRMKRHLRVTEEGAARTRHAGVLLRQLFAWGEAARQLHSLIRLPFTLPEEEAALAWLEGAAADRGLAAGMHALFYLERGRVPEALYAYARAFPGGAPRAGDEGHATLVGLLERAARDLPAAYHGLVVRVSPGAAPALRPLRDDDAPDPGDVALGFALPTPPLAHAGRTLLSVGPSLRRCPLVCQPQRVADGGQGEEEAGEAALLSWPDVSDLAAKLANEELLGKRLDAEVPRNHLDMRHRLDAQGKRYGKVIDYKISELRSIELLDSLCSDVKQGFDFNSTASVWVPTSEQKHGDSSLDRKENQRILDIYCGSVMEDHEEDLTDALRSGQLTEERVLDFLCREKAQVCSEAEVQARWPEATRSDSTDEVNTEL